ncbi:hypothetical protein T06_6716, partial [Trichinella sp. T6]
LTPCLRHSRSFWLHTSASAVWLSIWAFSSRKFPTDLTLFLFRWIAGFVISGSNPLGGPCSLS